LLMYRCAPHSLLTLFLVWTLNLGLAASPVIGVAIARGGFQVDGDPVSGNATLFDGNTLETGSVPSELRLENGVRMRLASESRGMVYRDRLILEKGLGELTSGAGYGIVARGLHVAPEAPDSMARVALRGDRQVLVAALTGTFRVTTTAGRMLAVLEPGKALEFEPQEPGRQAVFSMTGCLERRDGHYTLRDLIAGVVEEVRGQNLDRYVGDVVEVTASEMPNVKPITGAEEVIQIRRIRRVSRGCPAPPPTAPPARPAAQPAPPAAEPGPPVAPPAPAPQQPPAPSRGGMSGATKAVIAGVIIGGAGAGAAVFLTQKEDKGTISP
jgi:hypothetical protein